MGDLPLHSGPEDTQLLDLLVLHFNEDELQELCLRLDVGYESLKGETRNRKALELVEYFQRRERLPELRQAIYRARPGIADPNGGKGHAVDDRDQIAKLRNLFGLRKDAPFVSIYLSRLEILPAGTIGVGEEDITLGYSGPAINYVEYEGARALHRVLGQANPRDGTPFEVSIEVSPLYRDPKDFRQYILLGKKKWVRDKIDFLRNEKKVNLSSDLGSCFQ